LRFSNYLTFRAPVKSAIVTYNSIQKVFKARFDENRSNSKLTELSNFYLKQPTLTAPRIKYERLLGKNKESFFKVNTYKTDLLPNFNIIYDSLNAINFYFFDFPFLMSLKSDASRYFWFD
jgi:hypothetical protein